MPVVTGQEEAVWGMMQLHANAGRVPKTRRVLWSVVDGVRRRSLSVVGRGRFDVNAYFDVLRNLSMEPGYELDYLYLDWGGNCRPVLYARHKGQPPPAHIPSSTKGAEFAELPEDIQYVLSDVMTRPDREHPEYLAHVCCDGSPESFVQLAILMTMAGQFYLGWHCWYNDAHVVCDSETAMGILIGNALASAERFPLESPAPPKVLNVNVIPTVSLSPRRADVGFVFSTKWGGLIRRTFTVDRAFPHEIAGQKDETLVAYDCGLRF